MTSASDHCPAHDMDHRQRFGRRVFGALLVAASTALSSRVDAAPPTSMNQGDEGTSSGALAPVSPGHGADLARRTLARDLALQGTTAFENGDWVTALDRFERAQVLFAAPSIALMRARCLVRLGRLMEALTRYEEIQHMAVSSDASKPFRQAILDARTETEQLRTSIPRIRVSVGTPVATTPDGLTVKLDGVTLPSVLVGVERPIDPGTHELSVTAPGYRPDNRRVTLAASQHVDVEVVLTREAASSIAPSSEERQGSTVPHHAEEPSASSSSQSWGWMAIGTGGTALGVSVIAGVIALQKKSSLDAVCTPACPPSSADDLSAFRTNRTWSYVGLGLGVTSLAVGGYLLWRGSSRGPQLAATLGPSAILLDGTF